MKRHVVLLGLPGAGKSAVGPRVAGILGCAFCDLDARVEVATGLRIAEIFARHGEPAFRDAERAAAEHALAEPPQVVAAGGGWAAQPGHLERARGRALTVFLACTPETAAARLHGTVDRPLLVQDALGTLRRLAAERAAFYGRAERAVATDHRTIDEVADAVVALARSAGGW